MTNRKDWQTSTSVRVSGCTDKRFGELAAAGIHFSEVTGSSVDEFSDFISGHKEIFKNAARNGVQIRSVHLPFAPFSEIDPASTDKSVRDRFISLECDIVKISADCGAKIAVVHPSGEPYRDDERDVRMQYAVDSLSELQKQAKRSGIMLAIENLPRTCLCRDCADIKKIGEALPDAYLCFDSNHALIEPNEAIIRAMGARIVALHISDYDFINERHFLPGEGKNDWETIMRTLEEVGYSGTWNYEINNCDTIDAHVYKENHERLLAGLIK